MSALRVCTLGDLLLDVIARSRAQPTKPGHERAAETSVGAGGQAANVAAWAAELGAQARFVGKRSADVAGELVAGELTRRGVEVVGPVVEGRSGVVVSLVGPDGDRTMLSDRGVAPELRAEELDVKWFGDCDWLHLSGYSLYERPIDEAAAKAAGATRASGNRVSVDLSSAASIEAFGPGRLLDRLALLEPDVVFANEEEERALGGAPPAVVFVLKRGADGIAVRQNGEERALPAEKVTVVDTTGAGDALAAGFLVGGAELALEAAARCVSRLGAMP